MLQYYYSIEKNDHFPGSRMRNWFSHHPFFQVVDYNNYISIPGFSQGERAYEIDSHFFERLLVFHAFE
jgi:hypothetical protein